MTATSSSLAHLVPAPVSAFQRNEIASGLRRVCTQSELYWNAMSGEEFVASLGAAWSPADHVRHLTKTVRAVSWGMRVPKVVLWTMYGRTSRVSFSYDSLVARYHRLLREGGRAGRYAPSTRRVAGDAAEYRRVVLQAHRDEVLRLADRIQRWTRRHVDEFQLPHPLLGKVSVREMLMFVLYHNQHHVLVVARRRSEYFSDSTPLAGEG